MVNRRFFVGIVTCLAILMSVPSAFASGGGTKKDSTIKVTNNGSNPLYVFVDVPDAQIQTAAASNDPITAFNNLGGKQIAAGAANASFSVKAGQHTVTAVDIVAQQAAGQKTVTSTKGATTEVTFP